MAKEKFVVEIPVENAVFRTETGEVDLGVVADYLMTVAEKLRDGEYQRWLVDENGNRTPMVCEFREDE